MTFRIAWFTSGQDMMCKELLERALRGLERDLLDTTISFIFCTWEMDEAHDHETEAARKGIEELAQFFKIPILMLSAQRDGAVIRDIKDKEWRMVYGKRLRKMIYGRPFELGFIDRVELDEDTCARFDLIALYPSLPWGPRGEEAEIVRQVLTSKASSHGLMTRICVGKKDAIIPLTYCEFPLHTAKDEEKWNELKSLTKDGKLDQIPLQNLMTTELYKHIVRMQRIRWSPLVTYTLKMFAEGNLDIVNGKPVANGLSLAEPIDLTMVVNRALEKL
ncbi:MAG: hypothetical protein QW520_05705 [Methanomassiliicoccales archaeon]